MNLEDFNTGDVVAYVPQHAHDDLEHPDVECGVVSSRNSKVVFVKYFPSLKRFGWAGCTSQATEPRDLRHLGSPTRREKDLNELGLVRL